MDNTHVRRKNKKFINDHTVSLFLPECAEEAVNVLASMNGKSPSRIVADLILEAYRKQFGIEDEPDSPETKIQEYLKIGYFEEQNVLKRRNIIRNIKFESEQLLKYVPIININDDLGIFKDEDKVCIVIGKDDKDVILYQLGDYFFTEDKKVEGYRLPKEIKDQIKEEIASGKKVELVRIAFVEVVDKWFKSTKFAEKYKAMK